jgi:hypothetical protein
MLPEQRIESILADLKRGQFHEWATQRLESSAALQPDPQQARWIQSKIDGRVVHDLEYHVFARAIVRLGVDLVVDVGASYGYSATSLRALGYEGRVWSVEPLAKHRLALEHLAGLWPKTYRFSSAALSDYSAEVRICTPILRSVPCTEISFNVRDAISLPGLARNILAWAEMLGFREYGPGDLDFVVSPILAVPGDELFWGADWVTSSTKIAIKIDVEGHEAKVIAGCRRLLSDLRPILFVEQGSAARDVQLMLESAGYIRVDFGRTGQLSPLRAESKNVNALYLHSCDLEEK